MRTGCPTTRSGLRGLLGSAVGGATSAVHVYSGTTGNVLHEFSLDVGEHHGSIVRPAGDVNGDGHGDILVANSPDFDCAFDPSAYVWDGATGALLHVVTVVEWYELYAYQSDKAIAGAGDVNGDGLDDFALGVPEYDGSRGAVRVYSGVSGALLREVTGNLSSGQLGRHVAIVEDWNGGRSR